MSTVYGRDAEYELATRALLAAASLWFGGRKSPAEPTAVFAEDPRNTPVGRSHAVTSDRGHFGTLWPELGEAPSFTVTYKRTLTTDIAHDSDGTTDRLSAGGERLP